MQLIAAQVTDAWDYDGDGALARFDSADAPPRVREYGADGRLRREDFHGEVTLFGYTTRGDLAVVSTPDGRSTTTAYEYAAGAGRALPTRVTVTGNGLSTATETAYDALGHVTTVTEGAGTAVAATTTFVYGRRGELQRVTQPTKEVWNYGYDALLRLTGVSPPAGSVQQAQTFADFDGLGRMRRYQLGSSIWHTTFTAGLAETTTPMNERITALVDGRGRTVSVQYQAAPTNKPGLIAKQMAFDGWNALVGLQDAYTSPTPNETSRWTYDSSHRLASVTRDGVPVDYTYGNGTRLRSSRGAISWQYDAMGRLSAVTGPWGSSAVTWEPGGQRLAQLGDESFAYDGRGWLDSITSPLGVRQYSYDGRGNRLSESFGGKTRQFQVDASNRLTAVREWDGHIEAWQLAADGAKAQEKHFSAATTWPAAFATTPHIEHRQFNYNSIGALESIINVGSGTDFLRYAVDANGQVTSRTVGGQSVAYGWDVDGRLVSASMTAPGVGSFNAQYSYDGLGMRRRAQVTSTPPTGPPTVSTRTWKWAGADGEEEVDEDGNVTAWVGPFRVGEGNQQFGHDALGSVTSQDDGFFPATAEFSAWGQISAATAMPSSAGYAGGRVESLLGLNYNRRRWLDSTSGTFLSRDEVGAGDYTSQPNGLGAWSYAVNSPLGAADPDGRAPLFGDAAPLQTAVNIQCGGFSDGNCGGMRSAIQDAEVKANVPAATVYSIIACYAIPGCLPAVSTVGRAGLISYTAVWWAGLQGHKPNGGHIERIRDPVSEIVGSTAESANECIEKPGITLACGSTALTAVPGIASTASLVADTNLAKSLVLSAVLQAAPMDVNAIRTASRAPVAMSELWRPSMVSQIYRAQVEANVFRNSSSQEERFAAFLESTRGLAANESQVPLDFVGMSRGTKPTPSRPTASSDLPTFRLSLSDPEVAASAEVIQRAQAAGRPSVLSRGGGRAEASSNRRQSQAPMRRDMGPPRSGYNYDEYPFAATQQGGRGAYVEEILADPNQEAGRRFGRFLEGTGEYEGQPKIGEGDFFRVVIEP